MPVYDGQVLKVVVTVTAPQTVIMQNVYYWLVGDVSGEGIPDADILVRLDSKLTAMYGVIDSDMTNLATVVDATVQVVQWDVDHWEVFQDVGIVDISLPGGSPTDMTVHGAAGLVTAQTPAPKTRARKFLGCISEGLTTDGLWVPAFVLDLASFAAQWLDDVVWDELYSLSPVVAALGGLVRALISATTSDVPAYQRRRKPGVGV